MSGSPAGHSAWCALVPHRPHRAVYHAASEGPTPRDAPSDQLSTPPGGAKQSAELVPDVQLSPVQQPCLPDVAAGDSKDCFPISGEDRRERAKIERYWRMIQEQSENAERKKRNKVGAGPLAMPEARTSCFINLAS